MSTVKTNAILDASGGNTATINSMTPTADSLQGFRNRIINGAMVIDQRNAGASVTPTSNAYTIDRWFAGMSQSSKFSVQRSTTAPTGFVNSALITSTSAYSVTSSDRFAFSQFIEGLNCADLGWGTASAKTITLSFQVRSSLTGTFGGSLQNDSATRSYPFTYTISAANTWETKTVTIAGDTTGTWLTDTGIGIIVRFSLGTGSTYSGTAGAWAAADYRSATGAVSVVGTNAATWYVTGVQFEVGSDATPFERRDYGRELAMCQRYYINCASASDDPLGLATLIATTNIAFAFFMPVTMRTSPTMTNTISTYRVNWQSSGANSTTAPTISVESPQVVTFDQGGYSGLTAGNAGTVRHFGTGILALSAEL